ncbi:MAG: sugar kinase [Acidimicrobiales bacterium]
MSDIVTLGETMVLLSAPRVGRLRDMTSLDLGVAGAESNVAIGAVRLGYTASWIGRVGSDELGALVLATLRRERVDVSASVVDSGAPTALMVKERRIADLVRVSYYRSGLAGSRLCAGDVDERLVAGARVLHITGITPALGASALGAVQRAVAIARGAGALVSFDVNYRSALWTPAVAAPVLREMARHADVVFAGEDELALLDGRGATGEERASSSGKDGADGESKPDRASVGDLEAARRVSGGTERTVVVKRGAAGATSVGPAGTFDEPAVPVVAVDPVGAGDAFVAGYLAALLDGADEQRRLALGCRAGAFAVSVLGDFEGLPSRDDLALLDRGAGTTIR